MELRSVEIQPGQGHSAGRALLAQMYREMTGKPMPEISVGQWGKPYFQGSDVHFSISHTPKHVFCAISQRPIGIDAEELDRDIRLSLAEKFLSPGEYQQFQNAPDQRKALLKFWVLKEAAGKCSGEGLQLWPNHTDFTLDDPRVHEISNCLVAIVENL